MPNTVPNGGAIQEGRIWTPEQWSTAWEFKIDATSGESTNQTLNNPTINDATYTGLTNFTALDVTGATSLSGGGSFGGSFAGNPTFSGSPVINGGMVTSTGTTNASSLADRFAVTRNLVTDYGVVLNDATAATANTTKIQQAINDWQNTTSTSGAGARLIVPVGLAHTGPLTIAGQITIEGISRSGSGFNLATGSTAPLFTIQTTGTGPAAGAPGGMFNLVNLRLTTSTKVGDANAHGIKMVAGTWNGTLHLRECIIYNFPGCGITAASSGNVVNAFGTYFYNNGSHGINANSQVDWKFILCTSSVNGGRGLSTSGCDSFHCLSTNFHTNADDNVHIFVDVSSSAGQMRFVHCDFDAGLKNGFYYDIRGTGSCVIDGGTFEFSSSSAPNTYSDVVISSAANNGLVLHGCSFGTTHLTTGNVAYHTRFEGAGNYITMLGTQNFKEPLVTSRQSGIKYVSPCQIVVSAGGIDITGDSSLKPVTSVQVVANGPRGLDLGADTSDGTQSTRLFFSTSTPGQSVSMRNTASGSLAIATGGTPGTISGTVKATMDAAGIWQYSNTTGITAFAGGGQTNATQLTTVINRIITVATAADSVKLPVAVAGMIVVVINASSNACQVFGTSPATINGVATGTGVSLAAGKTALYCCALANVWSGGALA